MPGKIVTPEEWRSARVELLAKEKEHTKRTDELANLRAAMPMTKVTKSYTFTTLDGKSVSLPELFRGRRQLIVYHLMFDPSWDTACKGCSFFVDQLPQHLQFLHARDTHLVLVSRAPVDKLAAFQKRMGWEAFEWVSSEGSDFNYDFHATLDEAVAPAEYNFRSKAELEEKGMDWFTRGEQPGTSVFLKGEGGEVLHSYSCYARGGDHLLTTHSLLDLTPLGRQDKDEKTGKVKEGLGFGFHDEY